MNNLSMNTLILFVLLIGIGCHEGNTIDKHVVVASLKQITNEHIANPPEKARQTDVNIEKSTIRWKGTKMMRTGKHEGTLILKEGILLFKNDKFTGGYFIADMNSIEITDIPAYETIAFRNLTTHLKSDYNTQKYPESKFEITNVQYTNDTLLEVGGNMTIMDVSKNIYIPVHLINNENRKYFSTSFVINRFDWNIGKDGSWLEKKLVDKEIYLTIEIFTK